jgi:pyridoxamine--pyruvate transaminase
MAPGPVDVTPETLRAMQRPVLYHYDPAFIALFERTTDMLQRVFSTSYDVVIMQAEAILGLEAAVASLVEPGDKVLNVVSGVFGKWMEDFIRAYGGDPVELAVPYNAAVDAEDVRRVLRAVPGIKYLTVVHSETPSGTINPVREICSIAREFDVISIVDTVSGLGGELLLPDEWGIDVAVAGPQKCLGGTPGLSLISVSPSAWEAMESRSKPLRGTFLSLLDWKSTWIEARRFPYTPSVTEIYALESVLEQALREGMPAVAARHRAVARAARAAVHALGLELWAESESIATSCCTAVTVPEGVTDREIIDTMRQRYGVMIAGGYGDLSGKLIRLGHMGQAAHPAMLSAQLAMFERALADLGIGSADGRGVGAALQVFAGWDDSAGSAPA